MSFMNKVKNFFYEDVEEEVEDTVEKEPKKKFNPFKKEPKIEENVKPIEEPIDVKQEANNDLSERELFKSERTFNFPMDLGDEIFNDEEEKEEVKEEIPVRREPVREQTYTRSIYHNISREEPKRDEPKKKFRPSPVISPVYGILDKNYTVDDVVDVDKTKEFSLDKRMVDYDTVRNRAYKDYDEDMGKNINNDIFYNLDEEKDEKEDLKVEEPTVIITYEEVAEEPVIVAKEVEFKEPEVEEKKEKIPEVEETPIPEEEEEDISPDVKIETSKKKKNKKNEEKEEKKEDLFNLIDNMYNEDEEEEDE